MTAASRMRSWRSHVRLLRFRTFAKSVEVEVRPALRGGLQLASVVAIPGLAALQIWQGLGDPERVVVAVAAACAGLMGVAAAEFSGGAFSESAKSNSEELLKQVTDRILSGIRRYLEENLIYRADLKGIDAGLADVADPERAREAIGNLHAANRRIEEKSAALTNELEAARREIVTLRETADEAERLALLDALTQIGNRRFFDLALKQEMAACNETGADLSLALADIDRFKQINDKFGHVVGDHFLKSFAQLLTRGAGARVKVARYGGEEFALLFIGASLAEARRAVEALRRELEAKRWLVGQNEQPLGVVTASFGLAKLAPGESAESFIRRADARLMRAKALGRNRVVANDGATPTTRASA